MFDDATVNIIGGWQDVIKKFEAGKIQPSALFFEAKAIPEALLLATWAQERPLPAMNSGALGWQILVCQTLELASGFFGPQVAIVPC